MWRRVPQHLKSGLFRSRFGRDVACRIGARSSVNAPAPFSSCHASMRQLCRTGCCCFPTSGKTPGVWIGQARVESSPFGSIGRALQWQAGVGGCSLCPWHNGHSRCVEGSSEAPIEPREAIPEIPPHRPLELDEVSFCRNLRFAKKGAAAGPSGMTWEHLRPLLESPRDTNLLYRVASLLARGQVPPLIIDVVRVGRLTALRKSNGACGASWLVR